MGNEKGQVDKAIEDMKKDYVFADHDFKTESKGTPLAKKPRKDSNLLNLNSRREQLLEMKRQKLEHSRADEQTKEHPINLEVRRLLKNPPIDVQENPLKWYKENCQDYPLCAKYFANHAAAQATSVASERLFNKAGMIYDEKRSKLSSEKAEKLVYLCDCFENEDDDERFKLCDGCKPLLRYKLCWQKHR